MFFFFFGSSNGRLFSFPNTVVQRLKTTKAPNVTFTFICGAKRFLRFHLLGARQGKEKYRCPLYLDAFHFPNVAPAGSEKASRKVLGVRICNSDHRRATGNATGLALCRPFMCECFSFDQYFFTSKKKIVYRIDLQHNINVPRPFLSLFPFVHNARNSGTHAIVFVCSLFFCFSFSL
jgi:hypothetical protein